MSDTPRFATAGSVTSDTKEVTDCDLFALPALGLRMNSGMMWDLVTHQTRLGTTLVDFELCLQALKSVA
jgi:hypothetical protein